MADLVRQHRAEVERSGARRVRVVQAIVGLRQTAACVSGATPSFARSGRCHTSAKAILRG